jgi:hypothetical protein
VAGGGNIDPAGKNKFLKKVFWTRATNELLLFIENYAQQRLKF